jgi:hypothetical protein
VNIEIHLPGPGGDGIVVERVKIVLSKTRCIYIAAFARTISKIDRLADVVGKWTEDALLPVFAAKTYCMNVESLDTSGVGRKWTVTVQRSRLTYSFDKGS